MADPASGKRSRNLYDPHSDKPFKLSRSKLELYFECPRCFYIDRRLGVGRPDIPGYTLNNAVDELLKREFDRYRAQQQPHPIMKEHGVNAVPLLHPEIDTWRANFTGIQYPLPNSNLLIHGAVDDIWTTPEDEYIVVDYKATSTTAEITLDSAYRQSYKRQMEIYQWLLRRNGYNVRNRGYIVYANASKAEESFDCRLTFTMTLHPYDGSDDWVENLIRRAHACLCEDRAPKRSDNCKYCAYVTGATLPPSE